MEVVNTGISLHMEVVKTWKWSTKEGSQHMEIVKHMKVFNTWRYSTHEGSQHMKVVNT